jgi:hypothetical protein
MAILDTELVAKVDAFVKGASRSKIPANYGNIFPLPSPHFARVLKNIRDNHPDGYQLVAAVLAGDLAAVSLCLHNSTCLNLCGCRLMMYLNHQRIDQEAAQWYIATRFNAT